MPRASRSPKMQRPTRRSLAGDVVDLVANGVDRAKAVETGVGLRDGFTCMGSLSIANEIAGEQILVWNVRAQRRIGLRTQVELAFLLHRTLIHGQRYVVIGARPRA